MTVMAPPASGEVVYRQLLHNFPPKAIEWVKSVPWTGPVEVPLSQIDWDSEKRWAAHHQPSLVNHYANMVESGRDDGVNPVIGVRVNGTGPVDVIDGHHRTEGYRKAGKPVKMYIATVPHDGADAPWFKTHLYQIHQGADPLNKDATTPQSAVASEVAVLRDAMTAADGMDYSLAVELGNAAAAMSDILKPMVESNPEKLAARDVLDKLIDQVTALWMDSKPAGELDGVLEAAIGVVQRVIGSEVNDAITATSKHARSQLSKAAPLAAGFMLIQAIDSDGKRRYLLQYRAKDSAWTLPGGTGHPGETAWQAAKREVDEELGSFPDVSPAAAWNMGLSDDGLPRTVFLVKLRGLFHPASDESDNETLGWAWLKKKQVPEMDISPLLSDLWDELDFDDDDLGGKPVNEITSKIISGQAGNVAMKYDILMPVGESSLWPDDDDDIPLSPWQLADEQRQARIAVKACLPGWEVVSFAKYTSAGKIRIQLADLTKVGKEGYIHGFICVRPPCGKYHEAVFNSKTGRVHDGKDGAVIGKMRKNPNGTYSMTHTSADGVKTKLNAEYATRSDAAKSIALYHNVNVLRNEAGGTGKSSIATRLDAAKAALRDGDHAQAGNELAHAEDDAKDAGMPSLADHIHDTSAAVADMPKPVNAPAPKLPETTGAEPVPADELLAGVDWGTPSTAVAIENVKNDIPPLENKKAVDAITAAQLLLENGDHEAAATNLSYAAVQLHANGEHAAGAKVNNLAQSLAPKKLAPYDMAQWEKEVAKPSAATPSPEKPLAAPPVMPVPAPAAHLADEVAGKYNGAGKSPYQMANDLSDIAADPNVKSHLATASNFYNQDKYQLGDKAVDKAKDIAVSHADYNMANQLNILKSKSKAAQDNTAKFSAALDDINGQMLFSGDPESDAKLGEVKASLLTGDHEKAVAQVNAMLKNPDFGYENQFLANLKTNIQLTATPNTLVESMVPPAPGEEATEAAEAAEEAAKPAKLSNLADFSDLANDVAIESLSGTGSDNADALLLDAHDALNAGDGEKALDLLSQAKEAANGTGSEGHIGELEQSLVDKLDDIKNAEAEAAKPAEEVAEGAKGAESAAKKIAPKKLADISDSFSKVDSTQLPGSMSASLKAAESDVKSGNTQGSLNHLQGLINSLNDHPDALDEPSKAPDITSQLQNIHDKISVAAGLKKKSEVKPDVPYTVTNADKLAKGISEAAEEANNYAYDVEKSPDLADFSKVSADLKAGKAADVIRSSRKLLASAKSKSQFSYGDFKVNSAAAQKKLTKALSSLESQHDKDLSFQPPEQRVADLKKAVNDAAQAGNIKSYSASYANTKLDHALSAVKDGDVKNAQAYLKQAYVRFNSKYNSTLTEKSFAPDFRKLSSSLGTKEKPAVKNAPALTPEQIREGGHGLVVSRVKDTGASAAESFMATGDKEAGADVNGYGDGPKFKNRASHLIAAQMSDVSTQDLAKSALGNETNSRLKHSLIQHIAANGTTGITVHHDADVFNAPSKYFTADDPKTRAQLANISSALSGDKDSVPLHVKAQLADFDFQADMSNSGMDSNDIKALNAIGNGTGIKKSTLHPSKYTTFSSYYDDKYSKLSPKDELKAAREIISKHLESSGAGTPLSSADEHHLRAELVSPLIELWKQTSNDSHVGSLGMQRAAEDEFGIKDAMKWQSTSDELQERVENYYKNNQRTLRKFMRAQYDLTQQELKKAGITSVKLHRGMTFNSPDKVPKWAASSYGGWGGTVMKPAGTIADVKESDWRPISSWSHKSSEAAKFYSGGTYQVQVAASVPANLVVSTPRTGNGALNEREWVIMSSPGQVKIEKSSGYPVM